jgi:hypothetical protein
MRTDVLNLRPSKLRSTIIYGMYQDTSHEHLIVLTGVMVSPLPISSKVVCVGRASWR